MLSVHMLTDRSFLESGTVLDGCFIVAQYRIEYPYKEEHMISPFGCKTVRGIIKSWAWGVATAALCNASYRFTSKR